MKLKPIKSLREVEGNTQTEKLTYLYSVDSSRTPELLMKQWGLYCFNHFKGDCRKSLGLNDWLEVAGKFFRTRGVLEFRRRQ